MQQSCDVGGPPGSLISYDKIASEQEVFMADAEYYKVTAVDDLGNELVGYVKAEAKQRSVRALREEYGNAVVEPIEAADLPEGIEL
jgi:hypothetical protein